MMGLTPGIAVAVGNVDAHAAVPAVGVVTPGKLVMAMGTSICHMPPVPKRSRLKGCAVSSRMASFPDYTVMKPGNRQ